MINCTRYSNKKICCCCQQRILNNVCPNCKVVKVQKCKRVCNALRTRRLEAFIYLKNNCKRWLLKLQTQLLTNITISVIQITLNQIHKFAKYKVQVVQKFVGVSFVLIISIILRLIYQVF